MIFVTVGTHEQSFNRLIKYIDILRKNEIIQEEVFIQTGYSSYEPNHCIWKKMLPYDEMQEKIQNARIVITHGGPASFIMPIRYGKIPIVVPRQKKYDEHVNDHQVDFVSKVYNEFKNIIIIKDINDLDEILIEYDNIVKSISHKMQSNNRKFNENFEKLVLSLYEYERY